MSQSKSVHREDNKDKKTGKSPRMRCTVCLKPAVRYYNKYYSKSGELVRREIVYEHRDEPPVKEDIYNGKKYLRYRRCNAGTVKEGLPLIVESEIQQRNQHQQQQQQQQPQSQQQEQENSTDYLAEMVYSLRELDEISHDISGEDAKRILKNIWRWIAAKREELKKDDSD